MPFNEIFIEYTTTDPNGLSLLAAELAAQKNSIMRNQTAEEYRHSQHLVSEARPFPKYIKVTPENIAGVNCEWLEHKFFKNEKRIIIYLHGGSWMFGDLESSRPVGALLVKNTHFKVLVVDYRRAPEYKYPIGFNDCYDVYKSLIENGYSPCQIGIFGDSAGGNYTLALLNRLKEEKFPLPACVGLASPATDLRDESALITSEDDLIYTKYNGKECFIFEPYLGEEYSSRRDLPTISPITADLSGLPPMLIHTGGAEPISIDNVAYAEKVAEAGGEVCVKVWKDMFHDFTIVGNTLKESRQSMSEFGLFYLKNIKLK